MRNLIDRQQYIRVEDVLSWRDIAEFHKHMCLATVLKDKFQIED